MQFMFNGKNQLTNEHQIRDEYANKMIKINGINESYQKEYTKCITMKKNE